MANKTWRGTVYKARNTGDFSALVSAGDAERCPACGTLGVYCGWAQETLAAGGFVVAHLTGSAFDTRCGACGTTWYTNPETNPTMAEAYSHVPEEEWQELLSA